MPCWWSTARRSLLLALAASLAWVAPRSAVGQSPADRAALRALQDSLESLPDGSELPALSAEWRHSDDAAMRHLRRGWLALAAGRRSGKRGEKRPRPHRK